MVRAKTPASRAASATGLAKSNSSQAAVEPTRIRLLDARPRSLQVDQPALVCHRDRFGAADGIELGENGLDVGLGGAFGDGQPPRNVLVAAALGDELQHVELALSEARLAHALQRLGGHGG